MAGAKATAPAGARPAGEGGRRNVRHAHLRPRVVFERLAGCAKRIIFFKTIGEVTEWPKVYDWKSYVPQKGTAGSTPALSAIIRGLPRA